MPLEQLKDRIARLGVAQRAVGAAAGLDASTMSKVIHGTRALKAVEFAKMSAFLDRFDGMNDNDAAPYDPPQHDNAGGAARVAALSSLAAHPASFRITRDDLEPFGLWRDDVVIVDMNARPRDGGLVMVTRADPQTGAGSTLIRRLAGGALLPAHPADAVMDMRDVAMNGPIVASARLYGVSQNERSLTG